MGELISPPDNSFLSSRPLMGASQFGIRQVWRTATSFPTPFQYSCMAQYEYTVLAHSAAEGGFWAEVPALPGCLAQGETVEETLTNMQEAAEAHLQALQDEGRTVPEEEGVLVAWIRVREASAPATGGRPDTGSR